MGRLHYPTNAKYNFENHDIAEQVAYANPVVVSNKQIDLANALIEVTTRHNALNEERTQTRQKLAMAEARLEDFELALWSTKPPPTSERKSNKLLQAYTQRLVMESGGQSQFQAMQMEVRQCQAALMDLEGKIDNCRNLAQAIKQISENGRTFLAYVKDEARRSGGYA